MLADIYDLATARPHLHDSARFSAAEYRAYAEGYYRGVAMALQVGELAVTNYQRVTNARRAETRRKRSA